MGDLKDYIKAHAIPREDVFRIKVQHQQEGRPKYTEPLKATLDFIADKERVLLSGGKWMIFNQDYLTALDEYLAGIDVEEAEDEFKEIAITEPAFNSSPAIKAAGYELADKDFSIFKTKSKTPVEAWDLKRGKTVYAVKFDTPQKLGYACDQAYGLLDCSATVQASSKSPISIATVCGSATAARSR